MKKKKKKPACSVCGKILSSHASLTRHVKSVHTKERPFKCCLCAKDFVDKYERNRHMKRYHNKTAGSTNHEPKTPSPTKTQGPTKTISVDLKKVKVEVDEDIAIQPTNCTIDSWLKTTSLPCGCVMSQDTAFNVVSEDETIRQNDTYKAKHVKVLSTCVEHNTSIVTDAEEKVKQNTGSGPRKRRKVRETAKKTSDKRQQSSATEQRLVSTEQHEQSNIIKHEGPFSITEQEGEVRKRNELLLH